MKISDLKKVPSRQQIGILIQHENHYMAKGTIESKMEELSLKRLRLFPTVTVNPGEEGEGLYGFELSFSSEEENDVFALIDELDLTMYTIPLYREDTLEMRNKGNEEAELWLSGSLVIQGKENCVRLLATQLETFYQVELVQSELIKPSINPLPILKWVHRSLKILAQTDSFINGVEELVKLMESEKVKETEFYYLVEDGQYKFYTVSEVNQYNAK